MRYFLVDYENVSGEKPINLIKKHTESTVIIFYSGTCKNISLTLFENNGVRGMNIESHSVKSGTKNALDFQLSTHLGYLIGKGTDKSSEYIIVSKDTGYDCICDYWKKKNISVKRLNPESVKDIKSLDSQEPATKKQKKKNDASNDTATLDEIKDYLSPEDRPERVLGIFNMYKKKSDINEAFIRLFKDTKKCGSIFKKLKPLLKEKNKK